MWATMAAWLSLKENAFVRICHTVTACFDTASMSLPFAN